VRLQRAQVLLFVLHAFDELRVVSLFLLLLFHGESQLFDPHL
jgi:hypothetical protein